jgi:hypothetical protein
MRNLAFVGRNRAGKWSAVHPANATMPPWEHLDGPYWFHEAARMAQERNAHRDKRLKRNQGNDFRSELL